MNKSQQSGNQNDLQVTKVLKHELQNVTRRQQCKVLEVTKFREVWKKDGRMIGNGDDGVGKKENSQKGSMSGSIYTITF